MNRNILQIIAKKFSIPCPLFDIEVFKHMHDSSNGTANITVHTPIHGMHEMEGYVATSAGQIITDLVNTTGAVIESMTEAKWLHPAQEKGAKELFETYGPQVCEVKPFALTSLVSSKNYFLFRTVFW